MSEIASPREGGFSPTQYGLYAAFMAFANIMYSFASLGTQSYIYKFYPYYNDNLPPDKNDMMTLALLTSTVGFILVMLGGFVFKDLVIRKVETARPIIVLTLLFAVAIYLMFHFWKRPVTTGDPHELPFGDQVAAKMEHPDKKQPLGVDAHRNGPDSPVPGAAPNPQREEKEASPGSV